MARRPVAAIRRPPTAWPLATDEPLRPDQLIGREEELTALVDSLDRGEHQVLTGPPKSGKTSVARAAVATLQTRGWRGLTVDLFRTQDLPALVAGLQAAVSAVEGSAAPEAPLPRDRDKKGAVDDKEAFAGFVAALRRLDQVARAQGVRCVLCVDDLQEIVSTQLFGSPNDFSAALRDGLQGVERVVCLLVGSVDGLIRPLFSSEGQPLQGFGNVVTLAPIADQAWQPGLRSCFQRGGCIIDDPALQRLIEHGDHHARATALIARCTWAVVRRLGRTVVEEASVDEGLRAALAAERIACEHTLARIRTLSKHAQPVTLQVAKGLPPYKHLPPAVARQTLRNLEMAGIVEHPKFGRWRVVDPIFRHYLITVMDGESTTLSTPLDDSAVGELVLPTLDDDAPTAGPEVTPPAEPPPAPARKAPTLPVPRLGVRRGHPDLRHPNSQDAEAIRQTVANSVGGGPRGARFGAFVTRAIARSPNNYWQLDSDGCPLGGVLLRRPRGLVSSAIPGTVDPLAQLGVLTLVALLSVWGTALLVANQAWEWGTLGSTLLGAFACGLAITALMVRLTLGPARASWTARRRRAMLFEGVWGSPGAVRTLFEALADELPDRLLTGYAGSRTEVDLFRSMGFAVGWSRVLAGVLDPRHEAPLRGAVSSRRMSSAR